MFGFTSHLNSTPLVRKLSARLAFSRALKKQSELKIDNITNINKISNKFENIMGLDQGDRFEIAFFKRFGSIFHKVWKTIDQERIIRQDCIA
jgi:putative heme iron utilization protein